MDFKNNIVLKEIEILKRELEIEKRLLEIERKSLELQKRQLEISKSVGINQVDQSQKEFFHENLSTSRPQVAPQTSNINLMDNNAAQQKADNFDCSKPMAAYTFSKEEIEYMKEEREKALKKPPIINSNNGGLDW